MIWGHFTQVIGLTFLKTYDNTFCFFLLIDTKKIRKIDNILVTRYKV